MNTIVERTEIKEIHLYTTTEIIILVNELIMHDDYYAKATFIQGHRQTFQKGVTKLDELAKPSHSAFSYLL